MGWVSCQEDNIDAKAESIKRQVFPKSKVGKTKKGSRVLASHSEKTEQTRSLKSQFKLRRSPNSTRGTRHHQRQKKQQNGVCRNTTAYRAKKTQRLTFKDVQRCLFEAEKWRHPRKVSDWVKYVRAHFERSNRVFVPQVTLHRFVLLALCYLELSGVMEEDSEGRWGNRTQKV